VGIDGKDQDNGPLILLQLQDMAMGTARYKGLSCSNFLVINQEISVEIIEADVWYVMPCSLVERYQRFGESCIFIFRTVDISVLKTDTRRLSETLAEYQ
jgi:hypothetical protein